MAKVVILSGAGLSAESGISTFRDSGGLWEEYDVSVVCNYDSLDKNRDLTIEFYDKRRSELEFKEANHAHKVIAQLKREYPEDIAVITQNVDNLFEKAGMRSDEVIHLHGFMPEIRCRECEKIYNIEYQRLEELNSGQCPECLADLRPNIVFFGEQAPMYERLSKELSNCEFFIVIGTSGEVIGVNDIAHYVDKSILNNLEPSRAIEEKLFSKVFYMKATEAIDKIAADIDDFLS